MGAGEMGIGAEDRWLEESPPDLSSDAEDSLAIELDGQHPNGDGAQADTDTNIVVDLTVEVSTEVGSTNGNGQIQSTPFAHSTRPLEPPELLERVGLYEVPSEGLDDVDTPLPGLLSATKLQLAVKRGIDVAVSLIALTLLMPLMLAVAVSIKLSSPGPVLHRAKRAGKDGELFEFWKFRSMYKGAEDDRAMLESQNEQSGPVFKIADDPRIMPVGRFLRRSSFDELPQLFHVLSGTMSLVGPRPPLPAEVTQYDARAWRRLDVKPGLTCNWQTSGRSEIGFDSWVDMDIDYIESWSLWKDLGLMVKTIPAVIGGRGAY
jgi:lipopolysaccharide/colanic/teichoic acid biosynthesis glycosyltransferase